MKVSLDGHRDRMRERIENIGTEDIRSQELMELLLYYAVPRKDTKQMAFDLLSHFGSLEEILKADESALRQVPGIGVRIARWIRLLGDITGIYAAGRGLDRHRMNNLERSQAFLKRLFDGAEYHEVWQCCLNSAGRFISASKIADNASWGESEYLREALEDAIAAKASNVVIGQYSPALGAHFEEYDKRLTRAYAVTLAAADIQLMDHVLICPDGVQSMFQLGELDRIKCLPGSAFLRENYLLDDLDDEE